jgi:hypothetical protein
MTYKEAEMGRLSSEASVCDPPKMFNFHSIARFKINSKELKINFYGEKIT